MDKEVRRQREELFKDGLRFLKILVKLHKNRKRLKVPIPPELSEITLEVASKLVDLYKESVENQLVLSKKGSAPASAK